VEVKKEALEARYRNMDSEMLMDLFKGELTPLAQDIARAELRSRGISEKELLEGIEKIKEVAKKEIIEKGIYASTDQRFLARAIDTIIFISPLLLVKFEILPGEIGVSVAVLYFLFQDGLFFGKSIGKLLLGITVRVEHTGKACSFWRSLLRNSYLLLGGALMRGEAKKRAGDYAARTIVVDDVGYRRKYAKN
jgi:hypothetical protein